MLYRLLKIFIRLALRIFCKSIHIKNRHLLLHKGPLLVTANHPNSFLDAIIIGSVFKHPVHFLARGDAFNKPWHRRLLGLLQMVPIYRLSEGRENLYLNNDAFTTSKNILANNGIVLIFIEGICRHTHQLQPFKKGAARIAFSCWKEHIDVQVMPLAIQYDSLEKFGKQVTLAALPLLSITQLYQPDDGEAKNYLYFNHIIFKQLAAALAIEPFVEKRKAPAIIRLPAMFGKLLHAPLYYTVKHWVTRKTAGTVYYDAVLFGMLLCTYPVYLMLMLLVVSLLHVCLYIQLLLVVLHILCAYCTALV